MKDTQAEILEFWFKETEPAQWFQKSDEFDDNIKLRFEEDYNMGEKGIFDSWMDHAKGCLALCILLDQFPRNMFRDSPKSFAADMKALQIAKHTVAHEFDKTLTVSEKRFVYLPFEHSEDIIDQETSIALFSKIKDEDALGYEYAVKHYDVIKKFGRFPHRNAVLGRASTEAELIYLAKPGSGF